MAPGSTKNPDRKQGHGEPAPPAAPPASYAWLVRKLVVLVLVCAVVPMLLLGWGTYLHHSRFSRGKLVASLQSELDHHRRGIEAFLDDLQARLQLVTATHTLEQLADPDRLERVFLTLNLDHRSIADLGVIDQAGVHRAYIGPYDLLGENYAGTEWFREVMRDGVHVSDMFRGFRNEPHFVIAVTGEDAGRRWILRATIDTDRFRSLVESVAIGRTGEVCLLNRDGVYQTNPRFHGRIMERAPQEMPGRHDGGGIEILPAGTDASGNQAPRRVRLHVWLRNPDWLLQVQQDYGELFVDVNHASLVTLVFIHVVTLLFGVVAVAIVRRLLGLVRRRDAEAAGLNRQLLQTSKLAAIGELSAGVAHEINNPLAIITTERQLLLDHLESGCVTDAGFAASVQAGLDQISTQVARCGRITRSLLRFARRIDPSLETVDLNLFLREVAELVGREAGASGVQIGLDLEPDLPSVASDPSQLQQLVLNLVTNAMDALEDEPSGTVTLRTLRDGPDGVRIEIEDTGCGMPAARIGRIFDPFFTTKPEGRGTGLGLAICYSIVNQLGGEISVASEPGRGTCFGVRLPLGEPRPAPRSAPTSTAMEVSR